MISRKGHVWKGKTLWPELKKALTSGAPVVVYDLETTGLSPANDRVIEIAAIKYEVGEDMQMREVDVYHQYINPGRVLPEKIVELTGITDEQLADKPTEDVLYDDIKAFFDGCSSSGYNITTFDNKFMAEMYGRHGDFFLPVGVIDGILMARNRLSKDDVENYKLGTVGAFYGFEFKAHSAIEDARVTGRLIQQLINEYIQDEQDELAAASKTSNLALRPNIQTIAFWPGFRGFSRIYINTDMGNLFYDIRSQTWGGKDVDIANFDMPYVEQEAFRLTGSTSELEFAKFTGSVSA